MNRLGTLACLFQMLQHQFEQVRVASFKYFFGDMLTCRGSCLAYSSLIILAMLSMALSHFGGAKRGLLVVGQLGIFSVRSVYKYFPPFASIAPL